MAAAPRESERRQSEEDGKGPVPDDYFEEKDEEYLVTHSAPSKEAKNKQKSHSGNKHPKNAVRSPDEGTAGPLDAGYSTGVLDMVEMRMEKKVQGLFQLSPNSPPVAGPAADDDYTDARPSSAGQPPGSGLDSEGGAKDTGVLNVGGESASNKVSDQEKVGLGKVSDSEKVGTNGLTYLPLPSGVEIKSSQEVNGRVVDTDVNITSSTQSVINEDNSSESERVVDVMIEKKVQDEAGVNRGVEEVHLVQKESRKKIPLDEAGEFLPAPGSKQFREVERSSHKNGKDHKGHKKAGHRGKGHKKGHERKGTRHKRSAMDFFRNGGKFPASKGVVFPVLTRLERVADELPIGSMFDFARSRLQDQIGEAHEFLDQEKADFRRNITGAVKDLSTSSPQNEMLTTYGASRHRSSGVFRPRPLNVAVNFINVKIRFNTRGRSLSRRPSSDGENGAERQKTPRHAPSPSAEPLEAERMLLELNEPKRTDSDDSCLGLLLLLLMLICFGLTGWLVTKRRVSNAFASQKFSTSDFPKVPAQFRPVLKRTVSVKLDGVVSSKEEPEMEWQLENGVWLADR